MHAVILSIGDELVLGQTLDTNSAWLSARLAEAGIAVRYHQTLADDRPAIADAIGLAAERAPLVLITGGLGPTDDDLTRQALADALGRPLEIDSPALAHIERFFQRTGREMPPRNRVQAMRPEGTQMIENLDGTAPGIRAEVGRATLFVLPGVPREMAAMYERAVAGELAAFAGGRHVILATRVNTFGLGESSVAERLDELMDRQRNPKVGTTVADGIVAVRIRSEAAERDEAQRQLDETLAEVEHRLGAIAFGRDEQTLQDAVIRLLTGRGEMLVTAESCTGGLVGEMVTGVPGSSAAYACGWITYTNAAKHTELGVPIEMLREHGAVSEPVVRAMARGALSRAEHAQRSIAVTGIAGPGGGSDAKPVGTVWIALGWRVGDGPDDVETDARHLELPGTRQAVRDRAAKCALQLLRFHLLGEPTELLRWARSPAQATPRSS